jgi:anti-anti-sigma regulatory factor
LSLDPRHQAALERLGIDLESSLLQDARFLHDATLLSALHGELVETLGETEAGLVLAQLGFVHGLRDAWRAARAGLEDPGASAPGAIVPTALAMRLRPASADGAVHLLGEWPTQHEARARLEALGPGEAPGCHASAGYTSGWLSGLFGVEIVAIERTCGGRGDEACHFEARETSAWREEDDAHARECVDALPFPALESLVERRMARDPRPDPGPRFESGSAAIHVWGPVMVLPFSGPDESLRALELIGHDRDARGVRVVVVDLSGAIIDAGFGAVALERILDAISGWGAEPILTGISPLSMPVVHDLERSHLLIHKDLPEAIAAAFQIADVQRDAL